MVSWAGGRGTNYGHGAPLRELRPGLPWSWGCIGGVEGSGVPAASALGPQSGDIQSLGPEMRSGTSGPPGWARWLPRGAPGRELVPQGALWEWWG